LVQTHFVGLPLSLLQHAIWPDTPLHSIPKTYNIQIQFMSFPAILQYPIIVMFDKTSTDLN
jgi:RsiW-degrading membrane proteinase PrsW (M82 family)